MGFRSRGVVKFRVRDATMKVDDSTLGSARELTRFVGELSSLPVHPVHSFEILVNGEAAYPSMLEAIKRARKAIFVSVYQFDNDSVGKRFANAMSAAVERGVEVRVLLDSLGTCLHWPRIKSTLISQGIQVATFNSVSSFRRLRQLNTCYHRKIIVIDHSIGFTGGMNIRKAHMVSEPSFIPLQDVHFRLEGPVIEHLQAAFVMDWESATGERVRAAPCVFRQDIADVDIWARGIPSGPRQRVGTISALILGALSIARRSIHIVSPYFVPDKKVSSMLVAAALRGVEVSIVSPSENIPFVSWAAMPIFEELLEGGCRVFLAPPPFDHSKILVIDEEWALIGSSNWDQRSFYLNMEFDLECWGKRAVRPLVELIDSKKRISFALSVEELRSRFSSGWVQRLAARLLAPLL
jgi:cardiolipin synthase A/B